MTTQQRNGHDRAGLGDLVASMVGLGEATTRFTIGHLQNAVGILVHPAETITRVRDSMDSFSKAMNSAAPGAPKTTAAGVSTADPVIAVSYDRSEPAIAAETLTGRKQ